MEARARPADDVHGMGSRIESPVEGTYEHVDTTQARPQEGGALAELVPFVPACVARWIAREPERTHRSTTGSLLLVETPDDPAAAMVAAATYGGDLIKAIAERRIYLFEGRRHEARANAAADRVGPAAHVAVASGTLDLFLIGCTHRELFVCGDVVQALETSAATEIKRSALPVRERSNDGNGPGGAALRRCVPELVRSLPKAGRRTVAVAFIHLSNIDQLLEDAGPKATARHLEDLMHRIQHSFAEHDVAFVTSSLAPGGPRIVCATGIVRPKDNDDERLVRALREVIDYPSAIEVHAGIDHGSARVGYESSGSRRVFVLSGSTVRIASDLAARAQGAEIVLSGRVYARAKALLRGAVKIPDARNAYRSSRPPHLRHGVVNMLLNLGTLSFEHDDHRAAKHYFEEGLELSRRTGTRRDEALLLHRLAEVALAMRDPELAMVHCDGALAITRHLGDDLATAAAMITLGMARSADGDVASARSCWLYALETLGADRKALSPNPFEEAKTLLAAATARSVAAPSSDG